MNIYRLPRKFLSLFRIVVVLTVFAMAFGPIGSVYAQAPDTTPPASDNASPKADPASTPADTANTTPASDTTLPNGKTPPAAVSVDPPASDNAAAAASASQAATNPTTPADAKKSSTSGQSVQTMSALTGGNQDGTVNAQRDSQKNALVDTVFKPDPLAGSLVIHSP